LPTLLCGVPGAKLPIQARKALDWRREMQVLRQKREIGLNLLEYNRLGMKGRCGLPRA